MLPGSSENVPAKRAALGDLTNARSVQVLIECHLEVDYLEFTLKLQRWGNQRKGWKECRIGKGNCKCLLCTFRTHCS